MQRFTSIRLATFVLWLLAAGSVVFWTLKFVRGPQAPASANVALASSAGAGVTVDGMALVRGLGGGLQPVAADAGVVAAPSLNASRFVLTGVALDGRSASAGVALIAVDGKPARPYRVGAVLAEGVVLHSVAPRQAKLAAAADAPVLATLELPRLYSAVAGTAVPIRIAMPTAPPPVPNPAMSLPAPVSGAGQVGAEAAVVAESAPGMGANPATNPGSASGQKPARPLATRGLLGKREAQD